MDDELPLTALAKPKKANFDDDLPLANLAKPGGAAGKPGRPSAAGAPSAGQKPRGRPAAQPGASGQKRKGSSSSSSVTSTSSSDDSSSGESGAGKKKGGAKKRVRLVQKKKAEAGEKVEGEDNAVSKKDRSPKEQVVVDLLCRWWYALPDWPPNDPAFYEAELAKRSLRRVSIQEWEWVAEVDAKGFHKVYELSQFRGLFRKQDGEMVDIRPMENCPSYNNMMKKDIPELYSLLVKGYENQIKDLTNSKYDEKVLLTSLTTALNRIREKASQAAQMHMATGGAAKKARP